jgi:hypothetical protein
MRMITTATKKVPKAFCKPLELLRLFEFLTST